MASLKESTGAYYADIDDPGYLNPVSKVLEEYYQSAMQIAWDYLHPTEMAHLKEMADDLKSAYSPGN